MTESEHMKRIRESGEQMSRDIRESTNITERDLSLIVGPGGPPAERPPEPDDQMIATMFRIVSGALQKDEAKVRAYAAMLADQADAGGDSSTAERLRSMLADGASTHVGVAERRDPPAPSDGRVSVMLKMPYFMSDEDIAQLLQPYDVSELRVHDLAMYEGKYRTAACKLTVESLFALSREKRTHVVGCTANHAVALRAGGPAREEPSELLVAMTGMLAMFGGHDALDHDTDAAAKKCDKCRVLADARNAYGDAALSSGLPAPEEGFKK